MGESRADRRSANGIDRTTLARYVAADVGRAAPLFARILLVRAISRRDMWVAQDMIRDCGRAGTLAVADPTTLRLAQVLTPTHAAGRNLTTAMAAAKELGSAMRHEWNTFTTYHAVTDPERARDDVRWERAARDWENARHSVRTATQGLPTGLGDGIVGLQLLDRALDRVFRRGVYYQIRHYHLAREPERVWRRTVARALRGPAAVAVKRGGAAEVGSLADTLRSGGRALVEATPGTWPRSVARRLEEAAVPVFTGREPLTTEKATAIRLAALCLANEPEVRRTVTIADAYHAVFVGVTQLELGTGASQ